MNKMLNRRMASGLVSRTTIDLGPYRQGDVYVLPTHLSVEGKDLCDAATEEWIWSVGRNKMTGQIVAARDARFYQNPAYECLWLR